MKSNGVTADSTANIMTEVKAAIWPMALIILFKIYIATSEIVVRPRDTEAVVGQPTYLNCSTSNPSKGVEWYYNNPEDLDQNLYIYQQGAIQGVYKSRATIEKYSDVNQSVAFNLVIDSVNARDAGKYVCHEKGEHGHYSYAELIVLEAPPTCRVLGDGDGFIGPNSCDMEKEDILLSCETKYHGNIPPTFQWKNDRIESNRYNNYYSQNSGTNNVTSVLRFRPDIDSVQIQSSFHCQTTRSALEQYGCTIPPEAIKINYAFENFSISQMWVGDDATCTANSSQSCTCKWIWDDDGHSSVVSNNSKVTLNSFGTYRCEAKCSFRKKPCRVISAQIQVTNREASNQEHLGKSPEYGEGNDASNWKNPTIIVLGIIIVLESVLIVRLICQKNKMAESEDTCDSKNGIQDNETDNLMSQKHLEPDTETEISRTTENTCRSTDHREERNEAKATPKDTDVQNAELREHDQQEAPANK